MVGILNDKGDSHHEIFTPMFAVNRLVHLRPASANQIAGRYISGLVALIHEHVDSLDPSDARTEMERYLNNTLDHIRRKKEQADLPESFREKFASVTI